MNSLSSRLRLLTDCAVCERCPSNQKVEIASQSQKKLQSAVFVFVFYCACVRACVSSATATTKHLHLLPRAAQLLLLRILYLSDFFKEQSNIFNTHRHTHTCPL